MKRRDFLIRSGLSSSALLLPSLLSATNNKHAHAENISSFYTPIRHKVMMAMLSTQKQNWEHGIATQAFVEIGDVPMMTLMAKEAVLRQDSDGRLAVLGIANGITDSATPGEAVLRTSILLKDEKLKEAAERMLNYFFSQAPKTKEGLIHHSHHGPEVWADSMYMLPPFLAYAGFPKEAIKQLNGIREHLWIEDLSLFAYRWNDETQAISNGKIWGLANGHALHGMTKLIEYLPVSMEHERALLISNVKQHLKGCLNVMRDDYLFHDALNDPHTFIETSLSERLAYTLFKGIEQGWLNQQHLDTALNMRKAVYSSINEFGFITGIPGPPSYSTGGTSTEGQAFFLMMEAAYESLMKKRSSSNL